MKSKGMYNTAVKLGTAYVGYKVAKGAGKAIGRGIFGGMPRLYGSQGYYYGNSGYRYMGVAYDDCDVFYNVLEGKEYLRCDRDTDYGRAAGAVSGFMIFLMLLCCCCCGGGCFYLFKKKKKKTRSRSSSEHVDNVYETYPYETQPFTGTGYPTQPDPNTAPSFGAPAAQPYPQAALTLIQRLVVFP